MFKKKYALKLISILLLLIFVSVGAYFLIKKNISHSDMPKRDYWVVKFIGIDYPYELTFKKDIKIRDMLAMINVYDVEHIYQVSNKQEHEVLLDSKLTQDCTFKVRVR